MVIAMDHTGIYLTDLLALNMAPRQADDVRELLADLRAFRGGFAELEGAVDLQRIAITGHSAGGYASGELGDEQGVQLLMPMAAGGTSAAGPMSLILGAVDDQVVPYADAESGYEQTPGGSWWGSTTQVTSPLVTCAPWAATKAGWWSFCKRRGSRYRTQRVIWSSVSAPTDALKVR